MGNHQDHQKSQNPQQSKQKYQSNFPSPKQSSNTQFQTQVIQKAQAIFMKITKDSPTLDSDSQLIEFFNFNQVFWKKLFNWVKIVLKKNALQFDDWLKIVEVLIQESDRIGSLEFNEWKNLKKSELIISIFIYPAKISDDDYYSSQDLQEMIQVLFELIAVDSKESYELYVNRILDDTLRDQHRMSYIITKLQQYLPMINEALKCGMKELFLEQNERFPVVNLGQKSDILTPTHLLLLALTDQNFNKINTVDLLYSNMSSGTSFNRLAWNVLGYGGPTLLVMKLSRKHIFKEKEWNMIVGAFNNTTWSDGLKYQGDSGAQLFQISPFFKQINAYNSKGGTNYIYLNTKKIEKSRYKVGLGFGGDNDFNNYRLWIDDEIETGSSISASDDTFQTGYLAGEYEGKIEISRIEVWGLGGKTAIEKQINYRKEKQEELERMRKVDKKAFFSSFDQEMFFQKTFAHKGQVREDVYDDQENICQQKQCQKE